jgi:hypothetical protein
MGARAAAETRRIRYFDLVTGLTGDAQKGSIPLPLLQLEYFRRYQLDVQMAYYRGRGVDHERTADKLLTLSALAVGLGSFATGIAALLGSAVSPHWVSIAGLGAIAAALSAFASSREAVGQNRRNMERYRRTLEALESLSGKLDDVGMAAAMGEREPLERFVAAVHEQVSLEHRQWLEAAEDTMASVGRLEESLAKLRAKRPQTAWEETSPARSAAGSQS